MSSSRPSQSATSSSKTRQSARRIAQTSLDAKLDAEFEECGETFDYSKSVSANEAAPGEHGRSEKVVAYLQHIQRGKLIQPFGCLLALDEKTFRVTAYSENAPEMLTMVSHAVPSVGDHPVLCIGTDVRTLFTCPSTAALQKALGFAEVSLLNPVLVHCKISGKPFYAIMHRVTGSLIVDFEPVEPASMPMTAAGALQSYKLAAKAIAKLQSLPGGSMEKLCNTVVQEVFELTGYDRVMAYKFHEDDHGEVISEMTKPGLDPYLGLHYPATDIPQAARFLFMKNKVRMICDCRAKPVKIHQDESLNFNLTFCGSTLRAPHSCHAQYMENMNSIASLTMGVVINENLTQSGEDEEVGPSEQTPKRKRLWGLIVGHHESPRFIPFPLRYACEFLAQVFAIHVNKEFELENQIREKNILRTQSLLCDMLLKQTTPISIVSSSPNIMDLVKCDGAALVHQKKIYRLGLAPSESQIKDIAYWLVENHMDSTGLSTDSLYEAGYPGALALGDMVSGMAAARINSKDILFWFRAHTANEVQWGGAKHDPSEKDDGRKMHPRSSFRAFLEVVKMRSFPWSDYEMDAIHALQLILRATPSGTTVGTIGPDMDGAGIILERRVEELKLESMVELQAVTNEMVRLIETATVPILAVDGNGLVNGWNQKIAELTGLIVEEAIGKHLLSLVDDDSSSRVENMLYSALQGREEQNVQFELKTHGSLELSPPITLIANTCSSRDTNNNIVGACFIAQDITTQKNLKDQFTRIEGDYKSIVQNPNPLIPPIFGSDEFGWCSVWNPAMSTLTGWHRNDIIDKMLLGEVFGGHGSCCRMKNQDAFINLSVIINNAMTGKDKEKSPFGFYTRNKKFIECFLSVSKKVDSEGIVTGVFCFLHIMSNELQNVIKVEQISEQTVVKRLKALDYIKNEARNPLSGMLYCRKMIEGTELNEEQNRLLCMAASCQRQLSRVLDDLDVESFADSSFDLDMVEFELKDVVMTAVSQVLVTGQERGVRIIYDLAQWIVVDLVYGDGLRLQQIISNFLAVSVKFSPSGGLVEVGFSLVKDPIGKTLKLIRLEISIMHTGSGIPENLLSQMFGNEEDSSEEGLGLFVCRKLLKLMNGDVQYVREASKSSFNFSVELGSSPPEPMKTVL